MRLYIAAPTGYVGTVERLRDDLVAAGHMISHDWTLEVRERDRGRLIATRSEIAATDLRGVFTADALIALFMSDGARGAYVEVGAALARGIPVLWIERDASDHCVFQSHPGVSFAVVGGDCALPRSAQEQLQVKTRSLEFLRNSGVFERGRGISLFDMASEAYSTALKHGFWDAGETAARFPEKLALVHSEVSEALEELRQPVPSKEKFGEELADILIRVGDLSVAADVDLSRCVEKKLQVNRERPRLHGKRF